MRSFLGPNYTDEQIEKELIACGAKYTKFSEIEMIDQVSSGLTKARLLVGCKDVWSLTRALGARSIIADPRSPTMQKKLNLKIKYRESFRPFAPSVLHEDVSDWFEHNKSSPYRCWLLMFIKINVLKQQIMKINYLELKN